MSALSFVTANAARTLDAVLDLLYPPRCGGCGKFGADWWCTACQSRLHILDVESSVHELTLESGQPLTVISAALFTSPLREAIHAFKYEGTPQLARTFAAPMIETWRSCGIAADMFAPVPLHKSRLRERGFNQSERLATFVGRGLSIAVNDRMLVRIRHTQQQAHLSAAQRKANVRDAFAASSNVINGKRITLIDDVLTTGATLIECAGAMHQAGAKAVYALTLARAQP
jgi:ComF family protein